MTTPTQTELATMDTINNLAVEIHQDNVDAGWWQCIATGTDFRREVNSNTRYGKAIICEKLVLIHSEVSEALEGYRKNQQDEKLTNREAVEVELSDAVIRILDLAGALSLDIGGAIYEKRAYNKQRADHKLENRSAVGGKAF